jgi:hypothetical protein
MNDSVQALDFVIELVCMMPPLDAVQPDSVSRDLCVLITIGALFVLIVTLSAKSMKDQLGMKGIEAIVVGGCVALIGFIGMQPTLLKGIVATAYPPLVIALRLAEGAILGAKYRSGTHWWKLLALLPLAAGLYVAANSVSPETLRVAKGVWFVLGAAMASYGWTTMISADSNPLFDSPLAKAATFVLLASTVLYVQSSPLEQILFQWMLPIGVVIGFIVSRQSAQAVQETS